MYRHHLSRLCSLGRRNFSNSPELSHQNNFVIHHTPPPKPSPPPHADLPPPCRPPILDGPLMPRSHHHKLSSGRISVRNDPRRRLSSFNKREDIALEEEVERKAGWLLKLLFLGSASFVAFQFFPYMGDTLLQQSISLLRVKDPLFKRMGASRLARYAVDDERRMRVVEMGGAHDLLNVLEAAKDDKTRKEALKALFALSHSDEAMEALHQASAIAIIQSTPNSVEHEEVETIKSSLLKRFQELKHEISPLDGGQFDQSLCS